MEIHQRQEPRLEKLLGPVEVASSKSDLQDSHWVSADGKTKTAQTVIPRGKVKQVLTEMHGEPSGGHLGANKTLDKVRQRYYWLHLKGDLKRRCQQCDTCAPSRGLRTRRRGLMHQYNVGAPFERIAIDIAGPFPGSDRGNYTSSSS
jgi:hypothetical protein